MTQKRAIPESIRSGYNSSVAEIPANVAVKKTTTGIAIVAASTDVIYGVVEKAIPIGEYGDVVIRGKAVLKAGAVTTAGGRLMSNASGRAIDFVAGAGNSVLGIEGSEKGYAASGDGDLIEVELAGPATFATT